MRNEKLVEQRLKLVARHTVILPCGRPQRQDLARGHARLPVLRNVPSMRQRVDLGDELRVRRHHRLRSLAYGRYFFSPEPLESRLVEHGAEKPARCGLGRCGRSWRRTRWPDEPGKSRPPLQARSRAGRGPAIPMSAPTRASSARSTNLNSRNRNTFATWPTCGANFDSMATQGPIHLSGSSSIAITNAPAILWNAPAASRLPPAIRFTYRLEVLDSNRQLGGRSGCGDSDHGIRRLVGQHRLHRRPEPLAGSVLLPELLQDEPHRRRQKQPVRAVLSKVGMPADPLRGQQALRSREVEQDMVPELNPGFGRDRSSERRRTTDRRTHAAARSRLRALPRAGIWLQPSPQPS